MFYIEASLRGASEEMGEWGISSIKKAGVVMATATLAASLSIVSLFTKKLGGYDVQDFAYGLLTSIDHKKGHSLRRLRLDHIWRSHQSQNDPQGWFLAGPPSRA